MEYLQMLSSPKATVIRHSSIETKASEIPNCDVVVGDVVNLHAGQIVPADVRLFRTCDLQINESLLTGEALPALKGWEVLPQEDASGVHLGDYVNIAYAGTLITKGKGYGIVYAIGMKTEIGKLSQALGGRHIENRRTGDEGKQSKYSTIVFVVKRVLGLYNTSPLQKRLTVSRIWLTIDLQD